LSQVPPDPLFATAVFACPHENRDVTQQPLLGSAGLPHCIALPPGLGSGGTRGRWVYRDDSGAGNAFLCAILSPIRCLNPNIHQDRLWTDEGKAEEKRVFSAGNCTDDPQLAPSCGAKKRKTNDSF
jgi:hypothetical protein